VDGYISCSQDIRVLASDIDDAINKVILKLAKCGIVEDRDTIRENLIAI
jgi:hypothetical protein